MSRILVIVALVGLLMATGVAGAETTTGVRHPITLEPGTTDTPASEASVVVERGDHLWKISARHLGPEATVGEVAPYWRDVITANTPHLRSGDPDLIYPGEVVQLPATREQP
jgi:nucleoid-associated protein YgaU